MNLPTVPPIDLTALADLEKSAEKGLTRLLRTGSRVAAGSAAAFAALGAVHSIRRASERRRASGRRKAWIAAGIGMAAAGLARWQLQRLFSPGPSYKVEERRGDLEVRRYERIQTAHTTVTEPWDRALSDGFRRLARFIFGGNAAQTKIAMTSPVTAAREESGYRVSFAMPDGTLLPKPDDSRIAFSEIPARRVAVLRFNGRYDSASVEAKKRALVAAAEEAGYVAHGEPVFAGYDPPSTLPVLRRNEVWLEIDG